jgi:hypothetical protein
MLASSTKNHNVHNVVIFVARTNIIIPSSSKIKYDLCNSKEMQFFDKVGNNE